MAYENIIFEREGGVAIITLNRPEKLNAYSTAMMDELTRAFEDVVKDEDIRVLLLTGAGRGFCAGADIGGQAERAALRAAGKRIVKSRHEQVAPVPVSVTLYKIEKPTICAVNGVAVGIGLSTVLACDIRIASENARFGTARVRRGLIPDGGATFYMPRQLGTSRALELMYTGDIIDAREAERIGLVSRVVPQEELMPKAKELAGRIAKGPAVALEITKRSVYKALTNDIDSQVDYELWGQGVCYQTEDHKEAIQAAAEKREPVFKGR